MAQYLDHTAVAQKLLDQQGDITRLTAERDGAYRERAHLVALLAAMTDGAVITPATDIDEPGWQIVYLNLGGRQASWHISPRDADLFRHVERVDSNDPRGHWDGHTTEEKYAGIAALSGHTSTTQHPDGQQIAGAIITTLQQRGYSLPATTVHALVDAILDL
jgi:hypothetical protein